VVGLAGHQVEMTCQGEGLGLQGAIWFDVDRKSFGALKSIL
jgi:hypothetical protein